ncbi:hypothetical protein JCM11641_005553 [Rhodosporidiobolus odoratus]
MTVEEALPKALAVLPGASRVLVAGDFNLHHPLWEPSRPAAPTEAANTAVQVLADANLSLAIPPDTPTFFPHNGQGASTLDLVFADLSTSEHIVSCDIDNELESGSDHQPLRVCVELFPPPSPAFAPKPLFRKTGGPTAITAYRLFSFLLPPPQQLSSVQDVNRKGEKLTRILSFSALSTVPLSRPSPPGKANAW